MRVPLLDLQAQYGPRLALPIYGGLAIGQQHAVVAAIAEHVRANISA